MNHSENMIRSEDVLSKTECVNLLRGAQILPKIYYQIKAERSPLYTYIGVTEMCRGGTQSLPSSM